MRTFGGDFKLIVNENFGGMSMEIYGQVIQGNRLFIIGFDGENVIEQEITERNELTPLREFKPLLKIGRFQFESLVKAFVDYANDKKIHTEKEDLLQGKLTATETHLSDSREMNKKMLDAIISKLR